MAYYLRNQVTPYVILFIERDGSTYLTSLLISHPDVEAIYEQFAVLKQKGAVAADQLSWARELYKIPFISKNKARGFKTKLVDVLDPGAFAALLKQNHVKVIQMRRRNRVKAVISRINARRLYETTGNWNLYDKNDRMPPMVVDHAQFDQFLKEREAADEELQAYVDGLNLPTLKIIYEELLTDKAAALKTIFDFLNIPNKAVQERTLKNTSDDLRDVVVNLDELQARYTGTPYAEMFTEVLV